MHYETVKTPSKCSHNLWIIKVNKKPEITLPAVHCIHVIKFQLESLLSTHHIFSHFDFHSLFPVKKKSNRSFSCKAPRLAFSFLPPVKFEIFTAGFSSRIFIFPVVYWLRKSDYSSLWYLRKSRKCPINAPVHWLEKSKYSGLSYVQSFYYYFAVDVN